MRSPTRWPRRACSPSSARCCRSNCVGRSAAANPGSRKKPPHLPLLVQNEAGYRNLTKLLSAAYLEAEPGDWPHVKADKLAAHAEGLIALTGGPGGPVNALLLEGQNDAAEALLDRLAAMFPRPALCRIAAPWPGRGARRRRRRCWTWPMPRTCRWSRPMTCISAAANMYEAHDALLCIADGAFVSQDDRRRLTREHRFKTAAEMAAQFADLPEAIENTIEIARRCAFRPKKRNPILPVFVPESGRTPEDELRAQAEAGLERAPGRRIRWRRSARSMTTGWTMSSASSTAWGFPATS